MTAGIAPTSSAASGVGAARGRQTIAENFDAFLNLLTTQLKNQNPMDPMDANQFTQQLVQFASVEQQIKSNETLNALLSSSYASIVASTSGFIGAQITADGATSRLKDGKAEWRINAARAGQATITISDKAGNVVKTEKKDLQAGQQTFTWNGKGATGLPAPEGDYTITVVARDVSGQTISIKTEIAGRVESVDLSGDEPVLTVGGLRIPLGKVKSISRPTA